MKTYPHLNLFIVFTLTLCSCNKTDYKELGLWDDNIKLSAKTVEFNATMDSVSITTEGSRWWITEIAVDNKHYYDFSNIDLHSESYSIKQDCFDIQHRDKKTLFIKVDANPNNVKRIITIDLQDGDYFDSVTITQKPK